MDDKTTVYQHGTLAMLLAGLFEGTLPVSELVKHGNMGIGTADGLNGELVIVDGVVYQVVETGKVNILGPTDSIPFASVNYYESQAGTMIKELNLEKLQDKLVRDYQLGNTFAAITVCGKFKQMHTRVAPKQSKPYKRLSEAVKSQPEFTQEQVSGTIVGYYAPKLFQGATVGGFHLHFISDKHDFGGHILDFMIDEAQVEVQELENLVQHLPIGNHSFRSANLDLPNMDEEIEAAER